MYHNLRKLPWLWAAMLLWSPIATGWLPAEEVHNESAKGTIHVNELKWGDVSGRFISDEPPLEKDFVALLGPKSASNGIKNVVISAIRVSRVHESYLPNDSEQREIKMLEWRRHMLLPHVMPICVGETFMLKNADSRRHLAVIRPPLDRETNVLIDPGGEYRVAFHLRHFAPVPVTCGLHSDEMSYVFATVHPYVAVSDDYGNFRIRDLPAGEPIKFHVWVERTGHLPTGTESRFVKVSTLEITVPPWGLDLGMIPLPTPARATWRSASWPGDE